MSAAVDHYLALLLKERDRFPSELEALRVRMADAGLRFGEDTIPTFFRPYFLSPAQVALVRSACHAIMNCVEQVEKMFVAMAELGPYMGFSRKEHALIEIDPGYRRKVVVSRLDSFLSGRRLKFIEFNADSPAGAGYNDTISEIFTELPIMKVFAKRYRVSYLPAKQRLLDALLNCYKEYSSERTPQIAIVDWKEIKTGPEFVLLKEHFESRGYRTVIADPREVEFRNGKLFLGDFRIDLAHRRVIFKELLEHWDEVKDFMKACRTRAVCVVNPFSSKIAGNKAILSILSNERFDPFFTSAQNRARRRFIPWTRRVMEKYTLFKGKRVDLVDFVLKEKDHLVLKPSHGYGGKDVTIGSITSASVWQATLKRALEDYWVAQRFVPIPEEKFPVGKPHLTLEYRKINLNPFVLGGHYGGGISRLSTEPVINVSAGGGLVPNFVVSRVS